ncbi:hypothetical protein E6H36_11995 [Candidatus Bathyarchaeota archaeon]|nr:MAG: hypothetical protein E6H36_11995 [Candidatus Bathyarchaeota archaeon]TMI32385.1 MAG: hypothetical protein E6H29_02400 [Candidatus Bathyarchaeota archaeon]
MSQSSKRGLGPPWMEGAVDSGIEVRRILLLTRLRAASKGMTMQQLVRECKGFQDGMWLGRPLEKLSYWCFRA